MAKKKLTLTIPQFRELHDHLNAIYSALNLGSDEGTMKNTIVSSVWEAGSIEVTVETPES